MYMFFLFLFSYYCIYICCIRVFVCVCFFVVDLMLRLILCKSSQVKKQHIQNVKNPFLRPNIGTRKMKWTRQSWGRSSSRLQHRLRRFYCATENAILFVVCRRRCCCCCWCFCRRMLFRSWLICFFNSVSVLTMLFTTKFTYADAEQNIRKKTYTSWVIIATHAQTHTHTLA